MPMSAKRMHKLQKLATRRVDKFSLRGQRLTSKNVEPLEEIFKRVQFIQVDLENTEMSQNWQI